MLLLDRQVAFVGHRSKSISPDTSLCHHSLVSPRASYQPSSRHWPTSAAVAHPQQAVHRSSEPENDVATNEKPASEKFVWRENWYPVVNLSDLSKTRPNSKVLLNEDIVLWWGEDKEWHAARDFCPHKLAPLSEGRMDNGVLECRYHGWQFNKDGDCQFSPQSNQVPRVCLSSFPCQEAHGMLWIWPQTGSDSFLKASQKQPPVQDSFEGSPFPVMSSDYQYFEAAANWSLMLENAMDPSHAAALHEGNAGQRKDMVPMSMEITEVHPINGIKVKHNGYLSQQQADQLSGEREFVPPCTIRTHYRSKSGSKIDTCLFVSPARPGFAHVFGKFIFQLPEKPASLQKTLVTKAISAASKAYLAFTKVVGIDKDVLPHLFNQTQQNQDALMLHHCDRMMVDENDKSGLHWKKYRLASQADAGVGAFWQWIDKYGGEPDWAGDVTSANLSQHQGKEFLLNQYERHTKYCRKCLKALARVKTLIKGTEYGMAAFVAVAIIFKDTSSLRIATVAGLGLLFATRTLLLSVQSRFYGSKKLPDEE